MFYDVDLSIQLIEWLEILREQGFEAVIFYIFSLHPNSMRVLQ